MALSINTLLLIAATLSPAFAVPADLYPSAHSEPLNTPCRSQCVKGFFPRVRDSIIHTVWGPPLKPRSLHTCHRVKPSETIKSHSRYDNDVVLRFNIDSEEDVKVLAEVSDMLYLDVWESTNQWVDIRMAKDVVSSVLGLLPPSMQHKYSPLMHDLAQTVYESYPSDLPKEDHRPQRGYGTLHLPTKSREDSRELFFQEYQPLSVIQPWMTLLSSLFPSHVTKVNIGTSYEGRPIQGLRVGLRTPEQDDGKPRKTILVTGGSHAREWISTSTVTYIAYSLITQHNTDSQVNKLLSKFDFVFVPTINPDGYVYTWEQDRLWRKTRQPTPLHFCHGIDLDRSFGFAWDGQSATSNPCSESYAGGGPFEATEARMLANWARNQTVEGEMDFVAFLDLHSYSQQVLFPYSYSCTASPPSLEVLMEVGWGMAKGLRLTNNHYYGVSSACAGATIENGRDELLRPRFDLGGGSALDYFYHELGVKYAYQIKLRDTGSYGFLLPKTHIVPTGEEMTNAVLALGRYLLGDRGVEKLEEEKDAAMGEDYNLAVWTEQVDDEKQTGIAAEIEGLEDEKVVQEKFSLEEDFEQEWSMELRRRRKR